MVAGKRSRLAGRPPLSASAPAIAWLRQFSIQDQEAAGALADALVLLNEDDVAAALRAQLKSLARSRKGARRKAALYAEREYAEATIFPVSRAAGRDGIIRRRAVGRKGPEAVKPRRGSARVGSEGLVASVISQGVAASKPVYLSQPGPDRIRKQKVGLILIVTDFIGSGRRICGLLDKFMATPSVWSWRTNRWIEFGVVAAAGAQAGIATVEAHRTRPKVYVTHIAPAIDTYPDPVRAAEWRHLIATYGPREARGAGPAGFKDAGSLIAFSYRTPNNTPLLLHEGERGWRPLFQGAISDDLRPAFGLKPLRQRVDAAAHARPALALAEDLTDGEAHTLLVLRAIRGRWRDGQEIAFAEQTGLTVVEILHAKNRAEAAGLLDRGRLTQSGQKLVHAGGDAVKRRPDIPTRSEAYYPQTLRVPR